MKLFAVIVDGNDIKHFIFATSPDLVRREIASKTGTAHIVYCTALTGEIGRAEIKRKIEDCFSHKREKGGYAISRRQAILVACWLGQIKPTLSRNRNSLRRKFAKPIKRYVNGKSEQIAIFFHRVMVLR